MKFSLDYFISLNVSIRYTNWETSGKSILTISFMVFPRYKALQLSFSIQVNSLNILQPFLLLKSGFHYKLYQI